MVRAAAMVGTPRARGETPPSRGSGEWEPDLLPLQIVRIARPLFPLPANCRRPMRGAVVFSRCAAALSDERPHRTRSVCHRPQDSLQGPLLAAEGRRRSIGSRQQQQEPRVLRRLQLWCTTWPSAAPRRRAAGRCHRRRPPVRAPVLHREGGRRRACGLRRLTEAFFLQYNDTACSFWWCWLKQ